MIPSAKTKKQLLISNTKYMKGLLYSQGLSSSADLWLLNPEPDTSKSC